MGEAHNQRHREGRQYLSKSCIFAILDGSNGF